MDFFEEILRVVGQVLGTTLRPDSHNSCAVSIRDKFVLQMELDRNRENFIIGINLGELPPGSYREEALRQALKANASFYPAGGVFAYSAKKNSLIFFQMFSIREFQAHNLLDFLPLFLEKGELWFDSLKRGQIPQIDSPPPSLSPGPAGLRP